MVKVFVLAIVAMLSGCAYTSQVDVSPSYSVYSNYDDKLSGKYTLYVDSDEMSVVAKPQGINCSAHKFPVDASSQFETSVLKTFENLVEEVEVVDTPLDQDGLKSGGYRAQLVVRVRDMDVDLKVIPGFWSSEIEADVEITASVEAIGAEEGKLLGATIEGDADAITGTGGMCGGGAEAITMALEDAMQETMERLGERLTNARRMREEKTPVPVSSVSQ